MSKLPNKTYIINIYYYKYLCSPIPGDWSPSISSTSRVSTLLLGSISGRYLIFIPSSLSWCGATPLRASVLCYVGSKFDQHTEDMSCSFPFKLSGLSSHVNYLRYVAHYYYYYAHSSLYKYVYTQYVLL